MKSEASALSVLTIFFTCLALGAGVGWILNVVKIVSYGFALAEWGGMQVLRVVGVFIAPLGAILGYL